MTPVTKDLSSVLRSAMLAKPYDGISGKLRRGIAADEACAAIAADMKRRLSIAVEDGSSGDEQTRVDSDPELTRSFSSCASGISEECTTSPRAQDNTASGSLKLPVPCSYFAKGSCARGGMCRFAHGDRELQEAISEAGNHRQRVVKTQLCTFFARQRCLSGDRCFFAHGETDLRGGSDTCGTNTPPSPPDRLEDSLLRQVPAREPESLLGLLGREDPFEGMTSAKVHRWDEELGQWVVETLDIEDEPLAPCPASTSAVEWDEKVGVERKPLDLAAVLPLPAFGKDAPEGRRIKIQVAKRTPLRRSAALFVPMSQ